jgi:crotonobetainyl-CoA:carnitine CoA-transferase CaiB-like acyl-CoA transferase
MTLDVARAEGAALLCRLVEKSDVLVVDDALPPDLDYAALSRQNPRLIMTCVTETLPSDEAQRFIGLNAFAATLLPLITMSVLGRGQRIEVDGEECLAAAAMIVDDGEMHAAQVEKPLEMAPPRLPFSVDGVAPLGPVPLPGEDNDEVYCELLGLTGEELARLRREAIV